jgi:hypothetical protein
MAFSKGEIVKHPNNPEWGPGKILADSSDDGGSVHVFFVGVGEKTLKQEFAKLVRVSESESENTLLQNLKITKGGKPIRYKSLSSLIDKFRQKFPGDFSGMAYRKEERDYKLEAHDQIVELLNHNSFASLLEKRDFEEICKRARSIVSKTNLVFPNEMMALKDGLNSITNKEEFSHTLFELLYGTEGMEKRFEQFCDCLSKMHAAKWPIATYFLFLCYPQKHMFLKPEVTREAAEICGFELRYDSDLNWRTYSNLLAFSEYLFRELQAGGLNPVDMIDVQSFIWCTGKSQ